MSHKFKEITSFLEKMENALFSVVGYIFPVGSR